MGTDSRIVFLDYLRAIAAWLVVWSHFNHWLVIKGGEALGASVFVQSYIAQPLGIIQNFGWFGVCLFFLISGFIITHVARGELAGTFVVKRLLRIYPMLLLALAVALAVFPSERDKVTATTLITNVSLLNYWIVPQVIIIGVAWTLAIEMMFYILTAITQPLAQSPHRILLNLGFCVLVVGAARQFDDNFFLFAATVAYLPVLVVGQTLYWWLYAGRLNRIAALSYLALCYTTYMFGLNTIHSGFLPVGNSYLITVVYCVGLFVAFMHTPLRKSRLVSFLANTSYSVYLLHGTIGIATMLFLVNYLPASLALAGAATATLVCSWLTYLCVEGPCNRLARTIADLFDPRDRQEAQPRQPALLASGAPSSPPS